MVGQANAAPYNPTHYGMNVNDGPLSKLNLTKKQKSQIQAIQKSNHNNGKNFCTKSTKGGQSAQKTGNHK